jgi:hypothetical protein
MTDCSTDDARDASNVVPFPVDAEIAERMWQAELERTSNQVRPRINRRIRDAHRRLCGPRLPP